MTQVHAPVRSRIPAHVQVQRPAHLKQILDETERALEHAAQLIVWTGPVGRGKTLAAHLLIERVCARDDTKHAARYLLAAGSDQHKGTARQAAGARLLYTEILGAIISTTRAREVGVQGMARDIVNYCRADGTRLVVVDEAGALSAEQLRGIAMITDCARDEGVPLTVLLVGMDGLAHKLAGTPQVRRRVKRSFLFPDWLVADVARFVLAHAPSLRASRHTPDFGPAIHKLVALAGGELSRLETVCQMLEDSVREDPNQAPLMTAVLLASELKQEWEDVAAI